MTFCTTTEFLTFGRAVLRHRYVTDLPAIHGYTTTWMDYQRVDGHLQEVALDYDDIAPCESVIPVLILQASVRLHHGDLKQLFQSLKRRSWMQDEFKRLLAVVRLLAECVTDIDRRGCSLEPSLHPNSSTTSSRRPRRRRPQRHFPACCSQWSRGVVPWEHLHNSNFNDDSSAADDIIDITADGHTSSPFDCSGVDVDASAVGYTTTASSPPTAVTSTLTPLLSDTPPPPIPPIAMAATSTPLLMANKHNLVPALPPTAVTLTSTPPPPPPALPPTAVAATSTPLLTATPIHEVARNRTQRTYTHVI